MEEDLPDDAKCNYEDLEESFMSLTQLAVTIMYHSSKKLDLVDDSLYTSLSVNVLWCTLLTCKNELRRIITIPIENVITFYASKKKSYVVCSGKESTMTFKKFKYTVIYIEIVDIECVLGHESCLQFFSQVPL